MGGEKRQRWKGSGEGGDRKPAEGVAGGRQLSQEEER